MQFLVVDLSEAKGWQFEWMESMCYAHIRCRGMLLEQKFETEHRYTSIPWYVEQSKHKLKSDNIPGQSSPSQVVQGK